MYYRTRHLVARLPLRYERVELQPGDLFQATDVDARYLISRGRATAVPEVPAAAPVAPAGPALDVAALLGELPSDPPQAETPAETTAPAEAVAAEHDSPQASAEDKPLPFVSRGRRRRTPPAAPPDTPDSEG